MSSLATAVAKGSPLAGVRARVLAPPAVLASIVLVGAALRFAAALLRPTPALFPDEYIYSELARSIASTGQPLIRGGSAHFPALLAPLLTAPAWLFHDVEVSFRLVQAINCLAMATAAVPVYLIARRLGVGSRLALALAAFALTPADLILSSYLVAEPFAYPLALAAVAAAVVALERPTKRFQALFLGLCLLTALARVQFCILPLAYVATGAALGLRQRRLRALAREQWLVLGALGVGALGLAVVGVGYYGDIFKLSLAPQPVAASAGKNLLVLAYACGLAIVPGGLLGLGLALVRPRRTGEFVFAAFTASLAVLLVGQAAVYGSQPHERYVIYLGPLLAIGFALYALRGWPFRLAHALIGLGIVAGLTRVTLTEITQGGQVNSPFLVGIDWLQKQTSAGSASLAVVSAAIVVVGASAAAAGWRQGRVAVVVGLSAAVALAGYAGALSVRSGVKVRTAYLPAEKSWVDAAGLHDVPLLQSANGQRTDGMTQLFWNRSIDRVLLLPGAQPLDAFATSTVGIGPDGTLLDHGRPLDGPVVVDGFGSFVRLRGAQQTASAPNYDLWRPAAGPARLSLYFSGLYRDRWLAPESTVRMWPARGTQLRGRLTFTLRLPFDTKPVPVVTELPGGRRITTMLPSRTPTRISIPVCSAGPWRARLRVEFMAIAPSRFVSAKATAPVFHADAAACAVPRSRV
jgi:hypothetical protein